MSLCDTRSYHNRALNNEIFARNCAAIFHIQMSILHFFLRDNDPRNIDRYKSMKKIKSQPTILSLERKEPSDRNHRKPTTRLWKLSRACAHVRVLQQIHKP